MFLIATQYALMTALALALSTFPNGEEPSFGVALGTAMAFGSLLAVLLTEVLLFVQGFFIAAQAESTFIHFIALCLKITGFLVIVCLCCVVTLCCYFYRLKTVHHKSRMQTIQQLEHLSWQQIEYADGGAPITECTICYEAFGEQDSVLQLACN